MGNGPTKAQRDARLYEEEVKKEERRNEKIKKMSIKLQYRKQEEVLMKYIAECL